jgi:hypothetical protein
MHKDTRLNKDIMQDQHFPSVNMLTNMGQKTACYCLLLLYEDMGCEKVKCIKATTRNYKRVCHI